MRIFLTGATGTIGSAVTDELLTHGHQVSALARSDMSAQHLTGKGVEVVRGDLREPASWIADAIGQADTLIHTAATFSDDMGAVDRAFMDQLIDAAAHRPAKLRLVYTGGCWLYGQTGEHLATETDALHPIPAFSWMVENVRVASAASCLETMIVHPAMVYQRDGGVLTRFIEAARNGNQIEIWGSAETRWPVVHAKDLAAAYRLVAERGEPGEAYNAAAQAGVRVGDIADVLGQRLGVRQAPSVRSRDELVAEHGAWAEGPTLDQQMSGQKLTSELGWQPAISDILQEIR